VRYADAIVTMIFCVQLEELETQKRLRTEMIQMEDTLSQVRREYDLLRIEFEQMLAANEQTGKLQLYQE